MKSFCLLLTLFFMKSQTVFEFNSNCNISSWFTTNDDVMGGISNSSMKLDSEGNGVFSGEVSIENNGGFAMVRCQKQVSFDGSKIELRVKGDGKIYQFRVKPSVRNSYSYVQSFKTSGNWETIVLPLNEFYPAFRGRNLNIPNFDFNKIEELAILIGNKKTETFNIKIDKIIIK